MEGGRILEQGVEGTKGEGKRWNFYVLFIQMTDELLEENRHKWGAEARNKILGFGKGII